MTDSDLLDRNNSKIVESRISEVTVYTDRALITRRGTVALTGNERELTVASLPTTLETESVRATGAGTVAVRLLGVHTETVFHSEPAGDRTAELTQQIQELETQKRGIDEQIASRRIQLNFVENLSEKSVGSFASSISKQQIGLNEAGELLNFLGSNYKKYISAIAQHERQQRELNKQIEALRQQLRQVQTPHSQQTFNIIVAIEPSGSGNFELEISYVVMRASWTPLYDLRVNTTNNQINLNYLAEVNQNTGEDWRGVALTLSTAKPGMGTLPPKLQPWFIDIVRPQSAQPAELMRKQYRQTAKAEMETYGGFEMENEPQFAIIAMRSAAPEPEPIVAQTATATVSREGSTVSFQVGGNTNIPSDGTPHKVTIFSENYPSKPEYIAIPRLVSFAYLQAIITNPTTGATLLPGKANIFRDNTFVGTLQLDNISPGEEFQLNLGIDEGLKIERELVERQVDKKLIGNQRRTTYAYRLILTNLQQVPAKLTLKEQLPVPRKEQIKVRLTQTNPKIVAGEMGLLEWIISLPPQAKQELYYQFVVEHSPELTVIGLDI
ncbi:MAG: mucoidy inhibitor MuiA family protein [Microcoleus sp. PH2017_10_PVI_O_A]|uniref:mucoidy inhibitor MuiA family protein n=1 Tax=unclassified Microcoleus TaxID=2642155 RepID=UPI001E1522F8|nr:MULTISPECIES: mucoidy inhibitor MuiA family protein [unclassified Microcoleus]TAE85917.1 MAG: mucoidy inhibitor MuiA family protein [Oscillatoriales cyanobacterium]MCC3404089.1 mucoidy inhibitor MuiA family protein [Microcoleus sp. PH2017_10_PVI_O_A]MCC3458172.1 mucoidy inhibitor MuiA family protein [Microcoleus sp. PH2017_11_PCY_U_A]MCC3476594.1 mucoidy inhibitor MuiA family protein [Microcoleus sp. PH2017_12_PCY_D_A]MCC3557580.1 mucoidy inhibitor MuiA family protein [Microcoleus sp. PH201